MALSLALFINAAILILAAAAFHRTGQTGVAEIQDAYNLLTPTLGFAAASTLFAVALLASGQNSTVTATLAGQIVMEGFLRLRLKPWLRRVVTRLIAIVPVVIVTWIYGESGTARLLILSQVVLSCSCPSRSCRSSVHYGPPQDGRARSTALDRRPRLDGCGGDHRAQREAALRRRDRRFVVHPLNSGCFWQGGDAGLRCGLCRRRRPQTNGWRCLFQ